jgi:excisionase family DNA binding protein
VIGPGPTQTPRVINILGFPPCGVADTTNLSSSGRSSMTVAQAASYLGITAEAVRARIQRGTLEHTREGKTVYVFLPRDRTQHDGRHDDQGNGRHDGNRTQQHDDRHDGDRTALVEDLREQDGYLRGVIETRDRELEGRAEELAEMRRIVAALTQRIPELPAPEPRESPQTPSEHQDNGTVHPDDGGAEKPSWFRRFFGFE